MVWFRVREIASASTQIAHGSSDAQSIVDPFADNRDARRDNTHGQSGLASGQRRLSLLRRLWLARGFVGGLIAITLAVAGQFALIDQNNQLARLAYVSAIVVLLPSLGYTSKWYGPARLWKRNSISSHNNDRDAQALPNVEHRIPSTKAVPRGQPETPDSTITPATSDAHGAAAEVVTPVPTRPVRHRVLTDVAPAAYSKAGARKGWSHLWERRVAARRFYGPAVTVTGLLLSAGLLAASAFVLFANTADPLGAWLWVGGMAVLLLTTLGTEYRHHHELLPGSKDDFFSIGIPRIPLRLEYLLVTIILGIALLLRLWNLEELPGAHGDEGERGFFALQILQGSNAPLFATGWWDVPNVYFYGVSLMLRIFGPSMTGERMLDVLSSTLAVYFAYRTAKLLWGSRAGLLAAATFAIAPIALAFSRYGSESTPTGTLWAIGFFYLFMALRHGRFSDWLLAGIAWAGSLYFYASGRLIPGIIAMVFVYAVVRWRGRFFRHYGPGFVVLIVGFLLTFMPYLIFSMKENWASFTRRAGETSIFSPDALGHGFTHFGIPADLQWWQAGTIAAIVNHPLAWLQLAWRQTDESLAALYRRSDGGYIYYIYEHLGTILLPVWAALTLLAIAYTFSRFWDARQGLLLIWFWGGMMGSILTIDAPTVQRMVGAVPAMMLLPAMLLDRVSAAAWPINKQLARRWLAVPLVLLLGWSSYNAYLDYFVHYRSTMPFWHSDLMARHARSLGDDYKVYQLYAAHNGDIFYYGYGPTKFLAPSTAGMDVTNPAIDLPLHDENKAGAAFRLGPPNKEFLPVLQAVYPGGTSGVVRGKDGTEQLITYNIEAKTMSDLATARAGYRDANGRVIERMEPNVGSAGSATSTWNLPPGLVYPIDATWEATVYAPEYGFYGLWVPPNVRALNLDARAVSPPQDAPVDDSGRKLLRVLLAQGPHGLRVQGRLEPENTRLDLLISPRAKTPVLTEPAAPIKRQYLYAGPAKSGGLLGQVHYFAAEDPQLHGRVSADLLADDTLFTSQPISGTSINSTTLSPNTWLMISSVVSVLEPPALGYSTAPLVDVRPGPYAVRWTGQLNVPTAGNYNFEFLVAGAASMTIDGRAAIKYTQPAGQPVPQYSGIWTTLSAGKHTVDIRFMWKEGLGSIEWFWTPPGEKERALVPPTVLTPQQQSWTLQELGLRN